jgi:hypothetical protein
MKKFNTKLFGLLVICIGALMMTSCSSKPDNLAFVPKETQVVATTNLLSIGTKGGFGDLSQFEMFKGFGEEIMNQSAIMTKFKDDPFITGISYTSDILFFPIDQKMMCITMDLSSGDKFTAFVKDAISESGMPASVEEKENFKTVSMPGSFMMAWDDDKAIMAAPLPMKRPNLETEVTRLFNLKDEEQITSNPEFTPFYEDKRDLNIWMSTNLIEELPGAIPVDDKTFNLMKDNYVSMHLGFEKDQIVIAAGLSPNSTLVKEMEKYDIYGNGFNADLLKYFPKESYVTYSSSFNPSGYFKMMSDYTGESEQAINMFKQETGMDLNEVIKSLEGSILFSLHGFDTSTSEMMPLMTFAFDVNGGQVIQDVLAKVPADTYKKVDGYYEMSLDSTRSAYMIYNDKVALFTSDKSRIDAFKNGGDSDNLGSSSMASNIKKNVVYMYMNGKLDDYPADVKQLLTEDSSTAAMMINNINKYFLSVEMIATDDYKGEYIITTGDDGTNSLFKILKAIDDNYMTLMRSF